MMTSFNNGNSALSDMGYSEPFIEAMASPISDPDQNDQVSRCSGGKSEVASCPHPHVALL